MFQCYNCQRVGHSSANCNLGYRCVKCTGDHEPGNCPRKAGSNEINEPPSCVNWNEQHPANFRGCPYLKLAQRVNNNNKATRRNSAMATSALTRGQSYTSVTATTSAPQPQRPTQPAMIAASSHLQQQIRHDHTTAASATSDIKILLTQFRNDIITTLNHQNKTMIDLNNQTNAKISENSAKIDFIFKSLQFKWE